MTLTTLRDANPIWNEVFANVDFLMVGTLERLGKNGSLSESAALTALLLAKSLRLNHVALPLEEAELTRLCAEQLWTIRDESGGFSQAADMPHAATIQAGVQELRVLGPAVIDIQALEVPVLLTGTPLLISTRDGAPWFLSYRRYAYAEEIITSRLINAAHSTDLLDGVTGDEVVRRLGSIPMSEVGEQAIRFAVERKLSIITGGPGRGKTTVIASLLVGLRLTAERRGKTFSVALCAPTAKAAVRMEEAIKGQVSSLGETWEDLQRFVQIDDRSGSVHRLLGIRPDNTKSLRHLDHDFVIVDEVSMLDVSLLAKVIEHAPSTHLVFVGDADQLASVNVGAALRDMIDGAELAGLSGIVSKLNVNYRFRSEIDEFASAINRGNADEALEIMGKHPDVIRRATKADDLVRENVQWAQDLQMSAIASARGETSPSDLIAKLTTRAILCATRRGEGSVAWWSDTLARFLEISGSTPTRFQAGAPVLITENEQSAVLQNGSRLSNGDIGVARPSERGMEVLFGPPESPRIRSEGELGAAEPAWAITIHKSQGSEYDTVIVSLPHKSSRILTKELLYTAVTRARSQVVIWGSDDALTQAIEHETFRSSGLTERLATRKISESSQD